MIKKICILQNGLGRGGTDTFVVNLCRGIDKQRFDITVVNPSNHPDSMVREPDVTETGAKIIHTYPLNGLKGKLRHFFMLYRILRNGKYDIFQTNIDLFNGPNLFVAWLARVPIRCCHSHNGMQQKEIIKGKTISISIYQHITRWMCWHFSNRRIGCSETAMNFLYAGHNWHQDSYPSIINNGIDLTCFRQPIDKEKTKKVLGINSKYNIITVGRIIPQKNPLFIAKVFCELQKIRQDCDLIWIGTGEEMNNCRELLESKSVLDKVHFMGGRDDVPLFLKCSDLFILPSIFEGLPFVLIEAQAAGLNCLISDSIDKEVNCGGCYFMSLKDDETIWAKFIDDMISGKKKLSIDEKKMQTYSLEHLAKQMEKVFE